MAERTRSIVSGCLLHAVLGIGLDAFLCLRDAGWQLDTPTFWSWLGVTMYLWFRRRGWIAGSRRPWE